MISGTSASRDVGVALPLTAAQRGLFFAHHLEPANPCLTTAEVVRFAQPVDPQRLSAAVKAAYTQFEQLRTTFAIGPDGPVQRVREPERIEMGVVEVADEHAAQAWCEERLLEPLDISAGEVTRTALLELADGGCWWFHAAHHVVLDGYGAHQLLRRVAELYDGAAPVPAVPLADLVAADPPADDDEAFWDDRITGMQGTVSPAGRECGPAPRALRTTIDLDPTVTSHFGRDWPNEFLASVGAYVARLTGAASTRIGVPLMNRVGHSGTLPSADTVCTAMNVLPVTVPIDGTTSMTTAAVAADHAAVQAHPHPRQEDLARALRVRGDQLFGVQGNVVPFDPRLRFADVAGEVVNLSAGPVEDLAVCLRGTPGRGRTVRLEIDANPALYTAAEVDLHAHRIHAWLRTWLTADPDRPVADLPLPTADERDAVVARFNETAVERASATLGQRFADQVRRTPEAIALIDGDTTVTYAELATRAHRVAAGLVERGVGPGDVVGVALPRSTTLFEVIHGIALLGAVPLPLDPDLPAARSAAMAGDAGAWVIVTAASVPDGEGTIEVHADPDTAAYVLFTSGSTGRPKGVVVGHRAIDNRLAWMQHQIPIGVGDRVLHKTPISFDVSIWELFWPLQTGATVVVAAPGAHRDPRVIAALVRDHRIDVVHFVPSMLRAFLDDQTASRHATRVRHVVTSGEALSPDLVRRAADVFGTAPINLYGPTEAAIDVTWWDCDPADAAVPIGRPVWNTACLVLDDRMRPQPIGVPGELWLAGIQLADGYVGRPDLTAERFVAAPPDLDVPGGRLYRTGDLAAWRPDGALRYLGRTDDQVKIRGQRVELGEIEAAALPDAAAAALVGDRLVVWVAGDVGAARERAAARLPASLLPHHWQGVEVLPLTPSGKVDRAGLVAAWEPPTSTSSTGPRTLTDQRTCAAFASALDRSHVDPDDDFFALGGDSLRVLRLIGLLEDDLGVTVRLRDVFAAPTPTALAARITRGADHDTGEVLTLRTGAPGVDPLILLPPAGGLGWCYATLLPDLPPDLPVHTIQAPGLTEGRPEPVHDLAALAKRQLTAIRTITGTGRFHVAGWSLGGMAAHEVAAQAHADGQPVGAVTLIDAYPADQWRDLPEPDQAQALQGLLRLGGLEAPAADLDLVTAVRLLRESGSAVGRLPERTLTGCLASVVEAARITRTSAHTVFNGDVTIVTATAPRPETWLDAEGWRPYVRSLDVRAVDATHADLVRRPASAEVAATLSAAMS